MRVGVRFIVWTAKTKGESTTTMSRMFNVYKLSAIRHAARPAGWLADCLARGVHSNGVYLPLCQPSHTRWDEEGEKIPLLVLCLCVSVCGERVIIHGAISL